MKTTIISTHRLSGVKAVDEIIVMDKGEITERGSHDELIEKQGWYYDQFKKQEIKDFSEEANEVNVNTKKTSLKKNNALKEGEDQ